MSVPETVSLRMVRLLSRFKSRCTFCDRKVDPLDARPRYHATRDHAVPKIRGGGYDENNIVLACAQCNSVKDDMTEVEFRNFWAKGKLPRTYVEYLADSKLAKLKLPLR